ncbi:OmpA family protein [Cognatilysobacter bugurensis]|uniref:OmpA family protein n=1 Tax=Cognatilysobacter bugurensis TaxID=543356 RepID=UPI003CCD7B5E
MPAQTGNPQSDDVNRATQAQPAPSSTAPVGPPAQSVPPPAGQPMPATTVPAPTGAESSRFNMQENGVNRTADEFDAWLQSRGVRVATGVPAVPLVQNCPTPEGDKGDDDGDRIINCLDQCPGSAAGQAIGPDGCPAAISIDLQGVTFAYDAAKLDASARTVLDQAVEILKRHESLKIEVAGHTDSRGDAEYNQKLSQRRAKAVYDYLVEKGVDAARLIGPIGYGETRPLVPNQNPDGSDNPEARSRNRRTELNIQS